jgi:DNA-binding MarR family transcriptional regulator
MTTVTRTRTDAGLATALRISVSRLARRLRAQRAASGMTEAVLSETQLAALSALETHQAMTPGELAEHEKVQPPSMTRVIAVLEERQLVLRSPHPTDRRQVILTVTEEGRAVVQRVRRRKDAWLARRLAELTAEERATLRAAVPILEKLSQSLRASASGRRVPVWVSRVPGGGARVSRVPVRSVPGRGTQGPARER